MTLEKLRSTMIWIKDLINIILAVHVDGAILHPLNVRAEAVNIYAFGMVNSS